MKNKILPVGVTLVIACGLAACSASDEYAGDGSGYQDPVQGQPQNYYQTPDYELSFLAQIRSEFTSAAAATDPHMQAEMIEIGYELCDVIDSLGTSGTASWVRGQMTSDLGWSSNMPEKLVGAAQNYLCS